MTESEASVSRRAVVRSVGSVAAGAVGGCLVERDDRSTDPDGSGGLSGAEGTPCEWGRTDDDRLPWSTNGEYGGWGGSDHWETESGTTHGPVVFVHGNGRDACDWTSHAEYLLERGYRGDDCWAITFAAETSTHEAMGEELESFVGAVLAYTDREAVDVVAHSLGVTGARYWMDADGREDRVRTFVGLAGAFHGNCWCACCCDQGGAGTPCQFIAAQCYRPGEPLYELLEPEEAPDGTNWYTGYGTADEVFVSCGLVRSPTLSGAEENRRYHTDHDGVRTESRGDLYEWLTAHD